MKALQMERHYEINKKIVKLMLPFAQKVRLFTMLEGIFTITDFKLQRGTSRVKVGDIDS